MIELQYWREVLGAFGIVSTLGYLVLLISKYRLASLRLQQPELVAQNKFGITVMQPLLSGDPQLESMLRTNLESTPEMVRFLWLIDLDDQVAQQISQKLIAQYVDRASLLLCAPAPASWNPKSYKLSLGLAKVESEYVAVLDDDTSIPNGNLERAVSQLQQADLYTGLPLFKSTPGIGSQLVAHFVNNNSLMTYLAAAQLIPPVTINGMFYVSRTKYLTSLNAFESISGQLCDDLALAQAVQSAGGVIHQGVTTLELRMTVSGLKHYLTLMHRWFVFADILIDKQPHKTKLLLALLLGLPPILLWLSSLSLFLGPGSLWILCPFLIVRFAVLRKLLNETKVRGLPLNFIWSLLSELLQPLHFVHAKLRKKIQWRRHLIQVHRDGTFDYLAPPQ